MTLQPGSSTIRPDEGSTPSARFGGWLDRFDSESITGGPASGGLRVRLDTHMRPG